MEEKINITEIIKLSKFDDSIEIEQPGPLITIQGKTILTESNFLTLSGLPKSRKTSFMQFFIAAAFNNSNYDIKINIGKDEKIILIDTEQSIYDFAKQQKFLKRLINNDKLPKQFSSYLFRQYDPEVIIQSIIQIMETKKPKLLFIDNLTELALNPNDMIESKKIIQFLKKISSQYNCGVVCLLHLSKSNSFTLGNLGSYADRGAQSVLKVSYDKESQCSTMECLMLRSDAHFEPISIMYSDEDKKYVIVENPTADPKEKKKKFNMGNFTNEEILARCDIIYQFQKEYSYNAIVQQLGQLFGIGQTITKQTIVPYLIFKKIIITENGIYKY